MGHDKIYVLDWDTVTSQWNLNLVLRLVNNLWDNKEILFAVSGNFQGDNRDEIACFFSYGNDSTSVQRLLLIQPDYNWYPDTKFDTTKGNFDFSKVSHVVAGNFDGDTAGKKN